MPRAKLLPGAWLELIPAIPQLSPPEGAAQLAVPVQAPLLVFTVSPDGSPLSVGSSSSVTVIVKLALLLFPAPSVAV